MATRRAYVALGLSALALACAVQKLAQTPEVPRSPVSARSSRGPAPKAVESTSTETLDLSEFRPVLADAAFAPVRALVDQGDLAGAARKLWPEGATPKDQREAEQAFTAGGLLRDAKLMDEARVAFSASATWPGPLQADACLRAAEVALGSSDLARAREHLEAARGLAGEAPYERALAIELTAQGELARALAKYHLLCELGCTLEDKLTFGNVASQLKAQKPPNWPPPDATYVVRELRLERAKNAEDETIRRRIDEVLRRLAPEPAGLGDRLAELRVLVEAGQGEDALEAAKPLLELARKGSLSRAERCDLGLSYAKALALHREWGAAADHLRLGNEPCKAEGELYPAHLFNLAKFAAADGRDAYAVQIYGELERLFPESSLADDARLRAAKSYKDLGNLARFTELLTQMPEDYPKGDMTPEGVLELALYSAERNDWGAASLVLERGAALARKADSARGTERSGAERYFWARSLAELGQTDKALLEYESLVREVPLSYYMLHAFSRLTEVAPDRAEAALDEGLLAAEKAPFALSMDGLSADPVFQRGLSLLRTGELAEGSRVLEQLGLSDERRDSILWALALLLDRAGDAQSGHKILRGRLTDWLGHYPNGPWRTPWEVGFPRPYYGIVKRESVSSGVPEWLIYGVMREESTFDPSAESPAKAFGLMQLIEPTARIVGKSIGVSPTRRSLLDPNLNIRLGSRVLKDLLSMFRQNPSLAIPAYNAGPGRPRRWLKERPSVDFDLWVELIPIRETRRYTKRVLAAQAAYAFLYGPLGKSESLLLPKRLEVP